MTVSPSWSLGNYTVSWPAWGATGCTWYEPWPGWPAYACYWLEEKAGAGGWVGVQTPNYATSWSASGKPWDTYQYRLQYAYGDYYSGYQYVADGPVSVEVGVPPLPVSEQQEYASRHGDLDGDGDIDLYVKRVFGTSWQLPIAELVLRRNAYGSFDVETTVSQATRDIVNGWGISLTLPKLVDFNADGYMDILITGLSLANVGPYDVVVFAADGPGAPPPWAKLMDESIQQFAIDTLAYLNDPGYFANAWQYSCDLYFSTTWGWRWDIDFELHYYPIPYPVAYCSLEPNPEFSAPAIAVGDDLKTIFAAGEVIAGSSEAINVASVLGGVFGTTFMGNSLAQPGVITLPIDFLLEPCPVCETLETTRMARIIGTIMEIWIWTPGTDFSTAGPHVFGPVETIICHTSNPNCTLDAVFFRMRQYPAPGHAVDRPPANPNLCGSLPRSQCLIAVQNGDATLVEIREAIDDDDDVGLVNHVVDLPTHTLINITEEGHLFDPGRIVRRAAIDGNGNVIIVTTGSGTGDYPTLNSVMGPGVFENVDRVIRDRVEYDLGQL
jgi:hypothetical protein